MSVIIQLYLNFCFHHLFSATFTVFVTFGGILRSFGIYMVEFLTVYNTDSTSTTLIIGLQFACSGIGGKKETAIRHFYQPSGRGKRLLR